MRPRPQIRRASVRALIATGFLLFPGSSRAQTDSLRDSVPPPTVLESLREKHRAKDRWLVTTPASRLEVRVGTIGPEGLGSIQTRRGAPPVATIGWPGIARIERRDSNFRSCQILGLVIGSVVGGYAGGAIGKGVAGGPRYSARLGYVVDHGNEYQKNGSLMGGAVCAIAGAWIGGRLGDRAIRPFALYDATIVPGADQVAQAAFAENAAAEVRAKVETKNILRVTGSFPVGEFIGRVATIDDGGLQGLSPEWSIAGKRPVPREPLPWHEVTRVDRLGSAAGRGAVVGALIVGVTVGAFAASVVKSGIGLSGGGSNSDATAAGFGVGGLGALVGAGLGALIGSASHEWHRVYDGPATPAVQSSSN